MSTNKRAESRLKIKYDLLFQLQSPMALMWTRHSGNGSKNKVVKEYLQIGILERGIDRILHEVLRLEM